MKFVVISILVVGLSVVLVWGVYLPRVEVSYATRGYLRYHYGGKSIDVQITQNDLSTLKDMLVGRGYKDTPSCGFDPDVSIKLTDGRRCVVFCPACDTCPTFQIGDSNIYISISEEKRRRFDTIVRKYGMTFPCE